MPQFFVDSDAIEKGVIAIRGKDARHLRDVLRLDEGDWVVVCDGRGHRYRAEVIANRPLNIQLRRGEELPEIQFPCQVTLAVAVIRPQRFDWLVEKAFELGCRRLIPLTTERTVTTYIKDAKKQHARWSEIALSAAKQSGLPWLPVVSPLTSLKEMIQNPNGQLVYCWEGLAAIPLSHGERVVCPPKPWRRRRVRGPTLELPPLPNPPPLGEGKSVTILIGPEGGFSPTEHEQIMAHHPPLLSLGPLILRSETAAIVALTQVMQ